MAEPQNKAKPALSTVEGMAVPPVTLFYQIVVDNFIKIGIK